MCFSENMSYFNTVLLFGSGLYALPSYRLSIPAIYFSIKEFLQGMLYRYLDNERTLTFFGSLSWLHISFQPLFINILLSYWSPDFKYWNHIFLLSLLFGFYFMTILKEYDIQNDPPCKPRGRDDDFCMPTGGYMGNYHIGYRFKQDNTPIYLSWLPWVLLFFVPPFFTKSWKHAVILSLFAISIFSIYDISVNKFPNPITNYNNIGEKSAIWCFFTFIIAFIIFYEKRDKLS